jgi:hypothetical protein
MRLEFGVEFIFASFFLLDISERAARRCRIGPSVRCNKKRLEYRLVSLKKNDSSTFIAGGEIISSVVKLDCRYNVRYNKNEGQPLWAGRIEMCMTQSKEPCVKHECSTVATCLL